MGLKKKNQLVLKKFNAGISYKIADDKLYDAQNVYNNKDITETRFGIKRYNTTSVGGPILSGSFFKTGNDDRYKIVKVGTVMYKVSASGAATSIKTGLSAGTKHRGVTLNDRHIITVEDDGLFSYDGTTFTQLGSAPPNAGTVAIASGGNLVASNDYQVALTFYASSIGYETNAYESDIVSTTTDKTIEVTDIPTTAPNALIDTVRIYLKDVTEGGAFLFIDEEPLGTIAYDITEVATSTQTAPTTHGEVQTGGGKYITTFGKKIAYTGNDIFTSDVFISEDYLPDAFDGTATARTLSIEGQGGTSGIACGFYNDSNLDPYLVIFKKTSTTIYSEVGGNARQTLLDPYIGCVSNETIRVINGVVFFLSENGWYRIYNGTIIKDEDNDPISLSDGEIDDIFSRAGWTKELNRAQFSNFFSCVYSTHRQYWTFVVEGSSSAFTKAYIFERDIQGFRSFTFNTTMKCAFEGEDDSGNQVVFLGDTSGTLFTYSLLNELHDEDNAGGSQDIPAFVILPFLLEEDINSTYNYRFLTVRALSSDNVVTGKVFANWDQSMSDDNTFDFSSGDDGFILDVSQLDVDSFGNERAITKSTIDINKTADTIMIGFYQNITDANIGLVSAQLQYNKNGGPNR